MISYLSDAVDCLYDTYSNQTNRLVSYGYTKEEAFWIHFVSVSFMPWAEQSQKLNSFKPYTKILCADLSR